jgi:hypothetical protein
MVCRIARYFVIRDSQSANVPRVYSKSYPMTRIQMNPATLQLIQSEQA